MSSDAAEDDIFGAERTTENAKKLLNRFVSNDQTVDKEALVDKLEETIRQRNSCLKLPFTIVFFACYCCRVYIHDRVRDSSLLQRHVVGMVLHTGFEGINWTSGHKELFDCDVVSDIYTFLEEALLPNFINEEGADDRHRVFRYNQLIGGILMQQTRRKRVDCADHYDDLGPIQREGKKSPLLDGFNCYPWATESDDCFGPWNDTTRMSLPTGFCPEGQKSKEARGFGGRLDRLLEGARRLQMGDYVPQASGDGTKQKSGSGEDPDDSHLFQNIFFEHEFLDKAIEKLHQFQDHNWIDKNTAWLGLRFLLLNPDLGLFLHTTVNFYFPPSGGILPRVQAQSFSPEPYQDGGVIIFDAAFGGMLLWLAFSLCRRAYESCRGGTAQVKEFAMNIWNYLDLVLVVAGAALFGLWAMILGDMETIKEKALAVREAEPLPGQQSAEYAPIVWEMHKELITVAGNLSTVRIVYAVYTLIAAVKFLESFASQPRLAVVTRTIYIAFNDLFHFMLVFAVIFWSYCAAAMFIWGRQIQAFSSVFPEAMVSCFRMLMGDFDWAEMSETLQPGLITIAAIWFWSFMLLTVMVMLNMLMAIIMDAYTEVKTAAADSDPIWTQTAAMFKERMDRLAKKSVSVHEILKKVNQFDEGEKIDADKLKTAIGEIMSYQQAQFWVDETKKKVESDLNGSVTMSEAMKMIGWVKIAVQKLDWKLEEMLTEEREERNLLARGRGGGAAAESADPGTELVKYDDEFANEDMYLKESEEKLERIEDKMTKIEEFMQDATQHTSFRGNDLKNRLAVIENLIRSQRDATIVNTDQNMWGQMQPILGGTGGRGVEPEY